MLNAFRIVAILEGISYLLLFGLGMPLKYSAKIPEPNIIIAIIFCREAKWGIKRFLKLFLASLLPFGTFYVEEKYLKPLALANAKTL